jgi:putative hydrolase of the HAD superfamily
VTPTCGPEERNGLPWVVFDGDDTLWETERLYDAARASAGRVVGAAGFDSIEWDAMQRHIDLMNAKQHGLSRGRFPLSCVQAYEAMARQRGVDSDPDVMDAVRSAAETVFDSPAVVYPGAEAALRELRPTRRLALLTQGDVEVQRYRIDTSGLSPLFDVVKIVLAKGVDVLASLLRELAAAPSSSWLVGNSLASDINPACACGMRAIWIDAHVWEHERREALADATGVWEAASVAGVPAIIRTAEAQGGLVT